MESIGMKIHALTCDHKGREFRQTGKWINGLVDNITDKPCVPTLAHILTKCNHDNLHLIGITWDTTLEKHFICKDCGEQITMCDTEVDYDE